MSGVNGTLDFDVVIKTTDFKRQMDEIERRVRQTNQKSAGEFDALTASITKVGVAAGAYLGFSQLKGLATEIINVRGEFQQLGSAFNVMLGSKIKGDKLFQDAVAFAATTPFTLQDVGKSAKQLLAYGTAAGSVVSDLKTLGDVAAGVGAPIQDLVYLYGTLRTQGKAMTVDIRQFAGRGIPIYAELAKVLGVAKEKVAGMVEAGKVGFPEVEKAFQNMTKEGGQFNNMMAEQAKSLTGLMSNLQDAVSRMFNDIGKDSEGFIADSIKGVTSLVNNYKEVEKIIEVLVSSYGIYKAAILINTALIAVQESAFFALAASITSAADAQALLNLTVNINPYVALATVIVALGTAMYVYGDHATTAEKTQKLLNTASENASKAISEQIAKTGQLSFEEQRLIKVHETSLLLETELSLLRSSEKKKQNSAILQNNGLGVGAQNFNNANDENAINQRVANVNALKRKLRKILAETEPEKDSTFSPTGSGGKKPKTTAELDKEWRERIEKYAEYIQKLRELNGQLGVSEIASNATDARADKIISHLNLEQSIVKRGETIKIQMAKTVEDITVKNHENELKRIEIEKQKADEKFRTQLGLAVQLGEMLGGAGKYSGGLANVIGAVRSDKANGTNIAGLSVASLGLSVVGDVIAKIRQQKAEKDAYYKSAIQFQKEYNLELNNQLALEGRSSLLGDIKGQYTGQFQKANDAFNKLKPLINEIQSGSKIKISSNGSGLLGNKATYQTLTLEKYFPGIIKADGTIDQAIANKALNLSKAGNGPVDQYFANLIQSTLEWNKQLEDSKVAVDDLTKSIAGNLGESLRNDLIKAFTDGSDAAAVFGKNVGNVLEQISSQILFQAVFKSSFDTLSDDIKASFGINGDGTLTDDFGKLLSNSPALIGQYNAGLLALQQSGTANGLNLFQSSGGSTDQLTGSIKGVSEQTASVVAGQMNAMRITQALMNNTLMQNTEYAKQTAQNTLDIKNLMTNNGLRANGL